MNKDDAIKKLMEFKNSGCHLLIPTTQHVDSLSDQFEIIVETAKLSGHPKDRDVYPHETGQYDYEKNDWKNPKVAMSQKVRLTKHGLEKLNILAGIMWSPSLCREIRDPNIPGRIAYEAVGGVRKPDGTPYFIPKIYAMDVEVERQKLESLYSGKQNKDYLVNRDLLQKKSNIATLCESGAKNRVTREILNLKNFYTVAELEKEFVMVRIVPKLDLKDEYTKRRLIDIQLQALTGIYGGAPAEPPRKMIECAAPIDIKLVEDSGKDDDPPELSAKEKQIIDFQNADAAGQCRTITDLCKKVDYPIQNYLTRCRVQKLEDVTPKAMSGLFEHLLSLANKPNMDDVPY